VTCHLYILQQDYKNGFACEFVVAPYHNEVDLRLASVSFTTHVIYSSDLSPIIVFPFLIRFQYNIVRYMAIISHDNKVQNDYYVS
jgi:hypothetical protein